MCSCATSGFTPHHLAVLQRQTTHLLIVVGLAGDPEHGELFRKWGTTLAETAS